MEKLLFDYPEGCIAEHVPWDSSNPDVQIELPDNIKRKILPIPNLSEIDVVRHFTKLSRMNFGIDVGCYPLGSCTMKYNPKVNEDIARLEAFANLHPDSPEDSQQGSLRLMYELEQYLKVFTGMDDFSLQAAAGSQSELMGAMIAKAYYKEKENNEDKKRTKIIIPDSAHGTNPATAAMCKFEIVSVPTDSHGNIDLDRFKDSLNPDVALVMLTNPNTLGLFEQDILQISELAHTNGTLMYCDGANMNAFLGITRPRDQGFDMIHLNLHKTFSTPHGGGGPGAGVLGVKSFLADYLPVPRVRVGQSPPKQSLSQNSGSDDDHDNYYFLDFTERKSIGKVRCFYGNFGMLLRAYSYIRAYGSNIRRVSENAVLNANYLLSLLKDVYELPYDRRCAHEFVLSSRKFGQRSALNIAKRLLDYGVHPPTIYFPLIVPEALMIEPTETESRESLETFASALLSIAKELLENPELVSSAPHNTPIRRLDEVLAARKPNLRWSPTSI
ncbi:MAG TPA: aminomethyl-transferring glycine dehydrogenase subunit GcvPB [Candidatus Nitrosopolaris sp.]|nr:aminomethyl-transferring glycine dehydrogenase subunit GcvPB [Candidatus Nitrosopolaris sp.]